MNTFPTIISFYTPSWTYVEHAKRLIDECEMLGLNYYIKEYQDSGNWITNTRLKASFIHEAINNLKSPVLWIDVDGSIYKTPEILKLPVSVDFMGRHQRVGPCRTWHVGTMFFNYTKNSLKLIELWKNAAESGDGSDEHQFESVWIKNNKELGISFSELPKEYFMISESSYNIVSDPVIVHRLSKCPDKIKKKIGSKLGKVNNV